MNKVQKLSLATANLIAIEIDIKVMANSKSISQKTKDRIKLQKLMLENEVAKLESELRSEGNVKICIKCRGECFSITKEICFRCSNTIQFVSLDY